MSPPHLSKSRFLAGLQCPKRLWWTAHEPDAPELMATDDSPVINAGRRVGELARDRFAGGVLIDLPHQQIRQRAEATARAVADRAPAIFEASFVADDVFVAVDVLERRQRGFALVEVKSTLDVKDQHVPDVALQVHVLGKAGLRVERAEIMHLDRSCKHPRLSRLFVRENVTARVLKMLPDVKRKIRAQRAILAGPLPDQPVGPHCDTPYPCPFLERCHEPRPKHHLGTLYKIRSANVDRLLADGYKTLRDLPVGFAASPVARRQLRSVRRGRMLVEPGLREALETLVEPIAFVDFETVNPAVPVWRGCGPYQQVPVQWSCHTMGGGRVRHREWLADGAADPREAFARGLLEACAGAGTIAAYHASFERERLGDLAAAVPSLRLRLRALRDRLVDLLAIVRDHVYHPNFGGSFSLKAVAPALAPGVWYDDLAIPDGHTAAAALQTLLLEPGSISTRERAALRRQLLTYCKHDTLAMVRIFERLRLLAKRRRPD